jgi:Lipase (class 3)
MWNRLFTTDPLEVHAMTTPTFATTTPTFTSTQIIYALSTMAGAASDRKGSVAELEQEAYSEIAAVFTNTDVRALIGEWSVVWGPAVYQADASDVADNALYIAQNSLNPNELVIAISGTNPISRYGWIHEDLLINPLQPWPYTDDAQVQISNGTHLGLGAILGLADPKSGLTLLEFLAQRSATPLSLTITGHSLAGALSPALALALYDLQHQPMSWDQTGKSALAVAPSAGPAAGNEYWANYYDQRLSKNTARLWNQLDIVPHAWEVSLLRAIPSLYVPLIPESYLIDGATALAIANSKRAGIMLHENCDTAPLPGVINPHLTLTRQNIVTQLEILISNQLIQKIGDALNWSALKIDIAEKIVDELIEQLNNWHPEQPFIIHELEHAFAPHSLKHNILHPGIVGQLYDFIEFIIQAGYQHTRAYVELLGIQAFADLVDVIKAEKNSLSMSS